MMNDFETELAAALQLSGIPSEQAEMMARTVPDSVRESGQSVQCIAEKAFWSGLPVDDVTKLLEACSEAIKEDAICESVSMLTLRLLRRIEARAGMGIPVSLALYTLAEAVLNTGYGAAKEGSLPYLATILSASQTPKAHWKEAMALADSLDN